MVDFPEIFYSGLFKDFFLWTFHRVFMVDIVFSYHIISRLGTTGVRKGRFGHPKIHLSSKVAKFAG